MSPDDAPVDAPAAAPAADAAARRRLVVRRLPIFIVAWIAATAVWVVVLALGPRGALLPGVVVLAAQTLLLAGVGAACRCAPVRRRVVPIVVLACVLLGASSTALFVLAGGDAEVLAFVLLSLFLAAALLFAWGWRAELAVLAATLAIAGTALPWLHATIRPTAFGAAVLIGSVVALAIAEASGRAFDTALLHRRREETRQRELEASRDAYRDLTENARDFVYRGELDGRITYVNPALARFIGEPVAAIVGRRFHDFVTPHPDNPDLDAIIAWLGSGGTVPPLTFLTTTAAGPRWVEVLPSTVRDADGRIVAIRGIGRDVTDRKRATDALRDGEERFRNVFGNAPIGMAIVALDGRTIQVNRALCAMLGRSPRELVAAELDTVMNAKRGAADAGIAAALAALRRGDREYDGEACFAHADGSDVWGHVRASLLGDVGEEPVQAIVQIQDVTVRKQTEAHLRASERRYRGLVESQHDLIARFDVESRLTFVNDAYCAKLGRSRDELLGRPWIPLVHPDDVDAIFAVLPQIEQPPYRACVDARSLTPEGERWIAWEGSAIVDSRGRIVEVQAVGRDVTERREAELALRNSEERFRSAFDSASIGMVVVDPDGRAVQVNRAFATMVGWTAAELLGASFARVTHPDDVVTTAAHAEEALRGGAQSYHIEKRYVHRNGDTVWGQLSSALVRDALGAPLYFISQIQDITERKHAEEALRESEERYRGLVESQHDLVARFDVAGRYTYVNDAYCRMFDVGRDALVGRPYSAFLHPDDVAATEAEVERVVRTRQRGGIENRQRTTRGWRWLAWEGCAITDENGDTIEVQAVGRDVTERRAAEEALRASLEELRRSEERLRLLAQRQAQIREEERKRLGFDLHDNVCQELIGIAILVESMRRRMAPLPDTTAAELDRVVRYLHELVEHLRVLARDLRPMLLRDLGLEGSLRSLADGMASTETTVRAEFPTPIPRLDEDIELAVYRIAQEALANAVRHAAARTIVVTLAVDSRHLRLVVRDDGCGFDLAAPSDALGLVSMRERALALGGRFEVASTPGEGTVVQLECPLLTRAAA